MEKVRIVESDDHVRPNFTYTEFWKPKFGGRVDFDMPKCLVDAAQIMRDFWGTPMLITSTIRPKDKFGYHATGNACDYLPLNTNRINDFRTECLNYQDGKGSKLITSLREVGVQGFGLEANNCIHLDWRNDKNCASVDSYGKYIVFSWVADGTPNGKSTVFPRK